MNQNLEITLEFTPNPNTLKYAIDRVLLERGAKSFGSPEEAATVSPLAQTLLEVQGIQGVMIGRNFITVTKAPSGDWEYVHRETSSRLKNHFQTGLPVFFDHALSAQGLASDVEGVQDDVIEKIKQVLDDEIRPAVAMDGGDISFERFEDGIVYLYLQGSCAGCPSSTATLKMGIEARLKQLLPQVKEVVAI